MKTKEEIWNKRVAGWRLSMTDKGYKAAMEAMSEYAKQQAIAYNKYVTDNKWTRLPSGRWRQFPYTYDNDPITTEQLYNQFIESQNNS